MEEEKTGPDTAPNRASSHYLSQLKATIACDRRIHALISLYDDLKLRVEAVDAKLKSL